MYQNLRLATFLDIDFQTYNLLKKTSTTLLVKLCLSLHFIPLDPDPQTQMNADPTESGSTSLNCLYANVSRAFNNTV